MQVLQMPTMAQWDAEHKKEESGERGNSRAQQLEMNWEHGGGMGREIRNII